MFNRNDLTLTLFYASSTSDEGSKVAMFTVQSNTLQCITDKSGKKGYSVGEQTISNGSDPLLIALENYWRVNTEAVVNGLMADVSDFIAGNVSQSSTYLGFSGLKIFNNVPLAERIPESVLQVDGGASAG